MGRGILRYPVKKEATAYTIPNGVTSIEDKAFSGCSSLTFVVIPASVTSTGSFAFSLCENLKDIYYDRTEAERKSKIKINKDDSILLNAAWHYRTE